MFVVDSHHHVWDWDVLGLPDFPPEMEVLKAAHLPQDFKREIDAVGVTASVLVGGYPLSYSQHQWYFDVAANCSFITGVVGWIDMLRPEVAASQLDELQEKSKFVGIRHILDLEPDPNWMLQPEVMVSFRELARRDIPFDMCGNSAHLRNILEVLDAVPSLRIVVDHIGKPEIVKGGSEEWEKGMKEIAKHEQAFCKISGMIEEADWKNWKPADLQLYVDKVVEMFGLERLMFGSNWPVCRIAGEYGDVWEVYNTVLTGIGPSNRTAVFGGNAARFYRLAISE